MKLLLEDYEYKKAQFDAGMEAIEKLCKKGRYLKESRCLPSKVQE